MSLKSLPLLVFKGLDKQPLHGSYACEDPIDGQPSSIHTATDRSLVVTFEDASRHIITLGSTGTRKTCTVQAPAIRRLIETGCSGLIVDVKGEYRHLAEQFSERVKVIGADDAAEPFNLIDGMSDGQFEAFIDEIRPAVSDRYWGSMGLQDAVFIRRTYQLMGIEPTLAQVVDALATPKEFVAQFDAYMKWVKTLPSGYLRLLQAVRGNRFSLLAMGGSKLVEDEFAPEEEIRKQYTWQTSGLIKALLPFSMDRHLREKFSPEAGDGELESGTRQPSLEDLLYRDRKALLLDIPANRYGKTAKIISKLLRIRLIATITGFRRHAEIGCGDTFYTFFAADEYQDLVNINQDAISSGLYDDTTFFDRCRGFGHINIVTTQSVAALKGSLPKGEKPEALSCLLQNIGTAIVFSSSDPATDELLRGRVAASDVEHISSVVRSDLKAGEAFLVGRALRTHGGGNVVARFGAGAVAGAPHMSRYFTGLPTPKCCPGYTDFEDFFVNPFRDSTAKPPLAGVMALRSSFERGVEELLLDLEVAQIAEQPFTEIVMEDRDYRLSVSGCLKGQAPYLDQPTLDVVLESLATPGWRKVIPTKMMVNFADGCDAIKRSLVRFENPLLRMENGIERIPILSHGGTELSAFRQEEPHRSERFVELADKTGSIQLPLKSWMMICQCFMELREKYSEATLAYAVEDCLFDEWFEEPASQD